MYSGKTPVVRLLVSSVFVRIVLACHHHVVEVCAGISHADVAFWEGEQRVWYDEEGKKVTDDPRVRWWG